MAIAAQNNAVIVRQAENDSQLIALWLHGRSRHTQRAYEADVARLLLQVGKSLHVITLLDLQTFADRLSTTLAPASRHRTLSSIKSLFAFAHRLGYLPLDIARALRLPGMRDGLADRILEEGEVKRTIALEMQPRNHVLLTLLYVTGLRVSEICSLRWSDMQRRDDGTGQITVCGKRDKTRSILLPATTCNQLETLRGEQSANGPVFRSRKRGHLSAVQIFRIVRKAAKRAKIERAVSCHWLRHAHASHSLDRGAPISLVQATLGHSSVATTGRYLHARPSESSSMYLPV